MNYWKALKNPPPLTRENAWGCLVANQVVLPGLGSTIAGRRIGLVQMSLAIIGVVTLGIFTVWLAGRLPEILSAPPSAEEELRRLESWKPWFAFGIGALVFLVSVWCWALVTSISIVNQAKKLSPPPL